MLGKEHRMCCPRSKGITIIFCAVSSSCDLAATAARDIPNKITPQHTTSGQERENMLRGVARGVETL